MPTGISALASNGVSFEHGTKDRPAFTILQKDGLDSSLPLLHVNGDEDARFASIESARNELYNRRNLGKSNDHLVLASLQSSQANPLRRRVHSKSEESLNSVERAPTIKSSLTLSTEDFNEVLNAKLRRIQEQAEADGTRRGLRKGDVLPRRKPFITTVRTGEFLMPPPEVAALLGMAPSSVNGEEQADGAGSLRSRFKSLVSLGRRPEVRHSSHNARCSAALKATVDFTLGMMNASSMAAETFEERGRTCGRNGMTGFPQAALPKKLEPIVGAMSMLTSLRGDQPVPFGNIMFDRRVVRGSTCATTPSLIDGEQSILGRQAEARRRHLARKRAQVQASRTMVCRLGSPPPVPGRRHEPVQTDSFLQELFEKPDEYEVSTQTEYFLDRPPTPRYCPAKVGQDVSTQIEPGELFDFDSEVQPILETLVGKTMEQALTEVLEEEEIAALKEQQRRFLELRAAEKAEQRRLEEQERRIREEKDQRLREHEEATRSQKESDDRTAAAVLLSGYIADLLPAVLEGLKLSGFLLDDIKTDVEDGFMPWLMKEVKKELGSVIESRELLMDVIREILEDRAEVYKRLGEEYDALREKRSLEDFEESGGNADANFRNYEQPEIQNPEEI